MIAPRAATTADRLKSLLLYPLPHHGLSRLVGRITRIRTGWVKGAMIRAFVRIFRVDLSEAEAQRPGDWRGTSTASSPAPCSPGPVPRD
ncbi:MAG: hypothetical protein U5L11_05350 [Arhodomonas sp.]|nr:hypothetical protein [Arhodomonas sp.]